VAFPILADFDADPEKIRNEVIRAAAAAPAEPSEHEGGVAQPAPSPFVDEPPATPAHIELGWRGRPIALAALGAAVLARRAFDRAKTGYLEPLEMQVLAHLTLGPADAAQVHPGELFESLAVALACDHGDLRRRPHPRRTPARALRRRAGWRGASLNHDHRRERRPRLAARGHSPVRRMAPRSSSHRRRHRMTAPHCRAPPRIVAHPIRFGSGEWTCVVGAFEGGGRVVTVAKWRDGAIAEEYIWS
jgi:hypothetical protein